MILITGGTGFIGSHLTQALLDEGQSCVLLHRHAAGAAGLHGAGLHGEAGRVVTEQADVTDLTALREVGRRHQITGIVHLAGAGLNAHDPIADARTGTEGLLNVLQVAREWQVRRVGVASTIGVYDWPADSPLREDLPLPLTAQHAIPAAKKVSELLAGYLADATGMEVYSCRIAAVWGPGGRPVSRFFAAPQLVHAAVAGRQPDFSPPYPAAYAEDGLDLIYVRDCGRAIASLQLAGRLTYHTYNVGSGYPTASWQLVQAIKKVIPDADIELPAGRNPAGPDRDVYLDLTRIHADTGYQPAYTTDDAVADYIGWLRSGHER